MLVVKFYVIFYKSIMSRIGKQLIKIPSNVIILQNASSIKIIGKFGELFLYTPPILDIKKIDEFLIISQKYSAVNFNKLFGLYHSLINNMIS